MPRTGIQGVESHKNLRLKPESFSARMRNDFVTVWEEFFLNRTVDGWNRLASSQINAPSELTFSFPIMADIVLFEDSVGSLPQRDYYYYYYMAMRRT